jgi:L-threonylcarbamoyladenylate synthase
MKAKIARIDAAQPDAAVLERAAGLIIKGAVIVCPTDTGYAFAANALDGRAVTRVFQLKGRAYNNPIHLAVGSVAEAEQYAWLDEAARYLMEHYLPGALTLVLRKKDIVPAMLVAGGDTVGIRIPDNPAMLRLLAMTGKPLTTTSANISGRPTPYNIEEIVAQLEDDITQVALILDQGPLKVHEVSTIVDLTVSPPQLIRQGRISWLEVRETLRRFAPEDDDSETQTEEET